MPNLYCCSCGKTYEDIDSKNECIEKHCGKCDKPAKKVAIYLNFTIWRCEAGHYFSRKLPKPAVTL